MLRIMVTHSFVYPFTRCFNPTGGRSAEQAGHSNRKSYAK